MKWWAIGGVIIAILAIVWSQGSFRGAVPGVDHIGGEEPDAGPPPESAGTPVRIISKSIFIEEYGAPGRSVQNDLESVSQLLTDCQLLIKNFDTYFLPDNKAITRFLAGANPERIAWIPPNHGALNAEGELLDRNGVPLFFHRESALRIQVRSAGKDQIMWTPDDVIYPFEGGVSLPD